MNKLVISCIAFCLGLILISGCKPGGFGGSAEISGRVKHGEKIIPNPLVFVKFNTTQYPGDKVGDYDWTIVGDSLGNYQLDSLNKGNYYIFGTGFDDDVMDEVSGGFHIRLKTNSEKVFVDIPVERE